MNEYLAFLGHQPHISLAELHATLEDCSIIQALKPSLTRLRSTTSINQSFLNTLGGTILIAKHCCTIEQISEIPHILETEIGPADRKRTFSLRCIGIAKKQIRQLYHDCKKHLRSVNMSVRYVGADGKPVLPVVLHDEHILDGTKGCELTIVQTEEGLWIGKTVAAQDVHNYTKRDMEKPARDTHVGLLPPKLAQIMLNLGLSMISRTSHEAITVFDPFCGTGVIPMEATLRECNALCSDISDKAVHDCTANLEWTYGTYKHGMNRYFRVWQQDAQEPFPDVCGTAHVIVTETTLGPPLRSAADQRKAMELRQENEQLQISFLQNVKQTVPGIPLVCTWPFWRTKNEHLYLERTYESLPALGYELVKPPYQDKQSDRPSLLYQRPYQFVGREIVMLRPLS